MTSRLFLFIDFLLVPLWSEYARFSWKPRMLGTFLLPHAVVFRFAECPAASLSERLHAAGADGWLLRTSLAGAFAALTSSASCRFSSKEAFPW